MINHYINNVKTNNEHMACILVIIVASYCLTTPCALSVLLVRVLPVPRVRDCVRACFYSRRLSS